MRAPCVVVVGLLGSGCLAKEFTCSSDDQCVVAGTQGRCLNHNCAVPSTVCQSGFVYANRSPAAGNCVTCSGGCSDLATADFSMPDLEMPSGDLFQADLFQPDLQPPPPDLSGIDLVPSNICVNGSFEAGPALSNFLQINAGSTAITGWTVATAIDLVGTYWMHADGSRSLDLNANAPGSISQTLNTITGLTYNVRFHMAGNVDQQTTHTVRVAAAGQQQDFNFSTVGRTTTSMGWTQNTFVFTATGASTVLSFTSIGNADGWGPAIDNVTVIAQ